MIRHIWRTSALDPVARASPSTVYVALACYKRILYLPYPIRRALYPALNSAVLRSITTRCRVMTQDDVQLEPAIWVGFWRSIQTFLNCKSVTALPGIW